MRIIIFLTALLLFSLEGIAQRNYASKLDSVRNMHSDAKPTKAGNWDLEVGEDSCMGIKIADEFLGDNRSNKTGLWLCYYKSGKLKCRFYYSNDQRKIIDWYDKSGSRLAHDGLGIIGSISDNRNGTHDSIVTQLVDSLENGYQRTWRVKNSDNSKLNSEVEFFGDGRKIICSIYYKPDGTFESIQGNISHPILSFYDNGYPKEFYYESRPSSQVSFCYKWHYNGHLSMAYHIANEHFIGRYQEFDSLGIIRLQGNYVQIPGLDTDYVELPSWNFKPVYKKTQFCPAREGLWSFYNENGILLREEQYKRGILIKKGKTTRLNPPKK